MWNRRVAKKTHYQSCFVSNNCHPKTPLIKQKIRISTLYCRLLQVSNFQNVPFLPSYQWIWAKILHHKYSCPEKTVFFLKKYWTKGTFWKLLNLYCCEKKTHSRSCWDVKRCFDFRVQTGMTHRLATHVLALTNFNGLLDAILFFRIWVRTSDIRYVQSTKFPSILSNFIGMPTGNILDSYFLSQYR